MAKWKRDAEREAFWRAALARQRAGGLGVREFCRKEKLAEPSFYAWRRVVRERDAERRPATKRPRPQVSFVPMLLREAPRTAGDPGIVIELAAGRHLRLPAEIAATRLAELVHALEATPTLEARS